MDGTGLALSAPPLGRARVDDLSVSSGIWLRVLALASAVAAGLAVVSGSLGLGLAHEALAAFVLPPLVALVTAAWLAHPRLLRTAAVALGLVVLETISGVVLGRSGGARWAADLHLGLAAVALAATVIVAAACLRGAPAAAGPWRDYLALTKPRIMSLLLLTGLGGMLVGRGAVPPAGLFAAAVGGLALACGGASALNHLLDSDIDRLMGARTEQRPVAAGRVAPAAALEFGLALSAFSFVLLAAAANLLAAVLALAGNLFYVLVYTRWLKRATPQNIVIGGAAGAVPSLVGWAAATGHLDVAAIFLFLIVFLWTPPHFWALALLLRPHYAAAGVPMLPVMRGVAATTREILAYTIVLLAASLAPAAWGFLGLPYAAVATALGGLFAALALALHRAPTPRRARLVFHYSLLYLALLFAAMAADRLAS